MTDAPFAIAAPPRDILGESPVWSVAGQCLYWVDVRTPALNRLDPHSGELKRWILPEVTAAVFLCRQSVGLSTRTGLHAFDPSRETMTPILLFDEGHAENRLNDTRVDRQGRLWCSTMWDFGKRTTGALYRVGPDAVAHRMRRDITIPNGIAFSPDGATLYFADTPTGRLECTSLDRNTGDLGPWRFFDKSPAPGKPDGATVDSLGFVWSARYGGGCLARFTPDGALDRLVRLPVSQPSSCTFGGAHLETLYVTTSRQGLDAAALASEPLAGALLALDVGVRGLPEAVFSSEAKV